MSATDASHLMVGQPELRVLTLRQPWASAVALGLKSFETRSWKTRYRGTLLIQASAGKMTRDEQAIFYNAPLVGRAFREKGLSCHTQLPVGQIVASCELRACGRTEEHPLARFGRGLSDLELALGDYTPGRWHWRLLDVLQVKGPRCKGRLGLWKPDDDLRAATYRAMQEAAEFNCPACWSLLEVQQSHLIQFPFRVTCRKCNLITSGKTPHEAHEGLERHLKSLQTDSKT